MNVLIDLHERSLAILYEIGAKGLASSGYSQDTSFCIQKAIEEFIQRYTGKSEYDFEYGIKKGAKT
jgi:hypothetical protein